MDAIQINKMVDKIMNGKAGMDARKALDYLDGKQLMHVIECLNHPHKGRRNWQQRGFIPLYRNLTKSVVERSGMLFNHGIPTVSLYDDGVQDINEDASTLVTDYLDNADFSEFLITCDDAVRLLKTIHILTDYDSATDSYGFNMLHAGNSIMMYAAGANAPHTVAYIKEVGDEEIHMRVITDEVYEDWVIKRDVVSQLSRLQEAERLAQFNNPYGFIPVSVWHDTKIPRNGRTCAMDPDLINLNEALNLFYTDINYAGAWSLRKTLFTNSTIGERTIDETYVPEVSNVYKAKLPVLTSESSTAIAGPDQMVVMDTRGIDSPFVDFKGPDFDLNQLVELWKFMIEGVAHDWSVNIDFQGSGSATSGFQLIVEEIPNIELRKKRQRMASTAISRIVDTMMMMHGVVYNSTPMFQVYVDFPEYALPMEPANLDKLWFDRIDKGVATKQDYFVNVMHMTPDEAELKVNEIESNVQQ